MSYIKHNQFTSIITKPKVMLTIICTANCKLVWQNSNWNTIRPADKLEPDPLICPNKNMGMGKSFLDY